jgi:hypothetical protein
LKRLGCYGGALDGKWGEGTRAALNAFAGRAKLALSTAEPTEAAFDALAAASERVCPEAATAAAKDGDSETGSSRRRQAKSSSGQSGSGKSSGGSSGTLFLFGGGKGGVGIGIGF